MIFRFILFFILFYYLFKLIFRYLLPAFLLYRAKKMERDREAARQSYVHKQKANEGKVTVRYNPSENQERNNQTEGEYVDFEEIK